MYSKKRMIMQITNLYYDDRHAIDPTIYHVGMLREVEGCEHGGVLGRKDGTSGGKCISRVIGFVFVLILLFTGSSQRLVDDRLVTMLWWTEKMWCMIR
jgi:hypothetical protein